MTTVDAVHLEIPLEEARYLDILRRDAWGEVTKAFGVAYQSNVIFEGALPGIPSARIVQHVTGNQDAGVRVCLDASPALLTRPVLAAGRSIARALATRTSDRALMLQRMTVSLHTIEPMADGGLAETMDAPGVEAALAHACSPASPDAWVALERAVRAFGATVAIDLRDAVQAIAPGDLLLVAHGERSESRRALTNRDPSSRLRALVSELQARDVALARPSATDLCAAGLIDRGGACVPAGELGQPLSTARLATMACGAYGYSGIATGATEVSRAATLCRLAAATLVSAFEDPARL